MDTRYPRLVQHQQRALAIVRIFIGAWFLYAVSSKLDALWVAKFGKVLTSFANGTPVHAYAGFLREVAIPAAQSMAYLVILGEMSVGICLVLGLFTGPAALMGAFMNLNFLLATAGMGTAAVGLNLTFIVVQLALAFGYAGTTWGLDRRLVGKLPWWFQGVLHYENREF